MTVRIFNVTSCDPSEHFPQIEVLRKDFFLTTLLLLTQHNSTDVIVFTI